MLMAWLGGCSNGPTSADNPDGNLTLSIKGIDNSALGKTAVHQDQVTLTSARVVIEKIELENESDSSIDFKFDQPFVQDLLSISTLQEIQSFEVPPGTYDKVKVLIDDLDAEDGEVYDNNPQLQNLSIRIEGFVNEEDNTFQFSSDITLDVTVEFSPPLLIDDATDNTNIMIDLDYAKWFLYDGKFLDPAVAGNEEKIERNIEKSLRMFKDNDRDGEKDDDECEIKAEIELLGDDYIMVAGKKVFVTEQTKIVGEDGQELLFSDLNAGMCVVVHARLQEDGTKIALKIKVKEYQDDDGDDGEDKDDDHEEKEQILEAKVVIQSLEENYFMAVGTKIFVNDDTRIYNAELQEIGFGDLVTGNLVEVRAVYREDRSLIATKIKVKNETEYQEVVELLSKIDAIGENYVMIAETKIFVDEETTICCIKDDDEKTVAFSELQVGMLVEIRAVVKEDNNLVATKIEVE
jgi:hypothetical protein